MSNLERALEKVRKDKKLMEEHRITPEELDFLEKIAMFGQLKSVDDVLLILRNIRTTGK